MSHSPSGFPLWRLLALIGLAVGGFWLHRHFEFQGLDQLSLSRRSGTSGEPREAVLAGFLPSVTAALTGSEEAASGNDAAGATVLTTASAASRQAEPNAAEPNAAEPEHLRIATWALGGFGPQQARDPEVMRVFTSVIQRFDIVALQQVRSSHRDLLPSIVRQLNQSGRRYEYLAGPVQYTSSGETAGEQLVFLFDTERVVTDRTQLYTVADPENRLTYKPLVGWFRAASVDPQRAWTFSLVNVRVELARARQEVYELPRVIAAVQNDGRGEDDVIVAGMFQADHVYLTATLGQRRHALAIQDQKTDIFVRHQTSNIITDRQATTEAIGRGGVLDFLRYHNLSIAQAEHVSPYLPVFAEFTPWEGGY